MSSDYRALVSEVRDELDALERVIFLDTPEWDALMEAGAPDATQAEIEEAARAANTSHLT